MLLNRFMDKNYMRESQSAEIQVLLYSQNNVKKSFDKLLCLNIHAFKFHSFSLKNKLQKYVRMFCFSQWTFKNIFETN